MGIFTWFKSSKEESAPKTQQPTWDPNTLTMQQPSSPAAPTTERVVTEQPEQTNQENMQMKLRGGGAGDVCCGVCAGLLCFECCEECC
ncbi:hypothetical protein BDV59DRAFT_205193 [Aspergillus ambiguus]|uniref:uncharacterized protein n=1 Tax=Aspergillus ambiguus TaxID=176160 RepID=UPI003CCDE3CC